MVAGDDGGGGGGSSSGSRGLRTGLPSYIPYNTSSIADIAAAAAVAVATIAAAAATTTSSRSSAFHSRRPQFAGVPHQLRVSSNNATNRDIVVPVQFDLYFFRYIYPASLLRLS